MQVFQKNEPTPGVSMSLGSDDVVTDATGDRWIKVLMAAQKYHKTESTIIRHIREQRLEASFTGVSKRNNSCWLVSERSLDELARELQWERGNWTRIGRPARVE